MKIDDVRSIVFNRRVINHRRRSFVRSLKESLARKRYDEMI